MGDEPRKASEVILDLESKVDILLGIVKTMDLNIKILSNKLNSILQNSQKNQLENKIVVEAVDTAPKSLSVSPETSLPIEAQPKGFRRSSRPETYAGDNDYLSNEKPIVSLKNEAEVVFQPPTNKQSQNIKPEANTVNKQLNNVQLNQNSIPVSQRIVNSGGKTIFLADVEIKDKLGNSVYKTRTNGMGKWMASLPPAEYKVFIHKRESLTKSNMESIQDLIIDGVINPLELPTLIMK